MFGLSKLSTSNGVNEASCGSKTGILGLFFMLGTLRVNSVKFCVKSKKHMLRFLSFPHSDLVALSHCGNEAPQSPTIQHTDCLWVDCFFSSQK